MVHAAPDLDGVLHACVAAGEDIEGAECLDHAVGGGPGSDAAERGEEFGNFLAAFTGEFVAIEGLGAQALGQLEDGARLGVGDFQRSQVRNFYAVEVFRRESGHVLASVDDGATGVVLLEGGLTAVGEGKVDLLSDDGEDECLEESGREGGAQTAGACSEGEGGICSGDVGVEILEGAVVVQDPADGVGSPAPVVVADFP